MKIISFSKEIALYGKILEPFDAKKKKNISQRMELQMKRIRIELFIRNNKFPQLLMQG